ncbi:MAG: SapC family protein [Nitrospiraceae bacterium]|nr:SapC family protein [Nitrospiraceae bacterium]
MYSKPVAINSKTHRDLKIAPVKDYGFARGFNSCILTGHEFVDASKDYPVVFMGSNDRITPVAVLGIKSNLFVDEEGKWEEGAYVPGYIRRVPFILAEGLAADGSLTVCVDSEYAGFDAKEGMRLFTDEEEQTPELKKIIEFLRIYNNQHAITGVFTSLLKSLNLFKAVDANITLAKGGKFTLKNLLMVDEKALMKLQDSEIVSMVRQGFMGWIYAHLFSLGSFKKILERSGRGK